MLLCGRPLLGGKRVGDRDAVPAQVELALFGRSNVSPEETAMSACTSA